MIIIQPSQTMMFVVYLCFRFIDTTTSLEKQYYQYTSRSYCIRFIFFTTQKNKYININNENT